MKLKCNECGDYLYDGNEDEINSKCVCGGRFKKK